MSHNFLKKVTDTMQRGEERKLDIANREKHVHDGRLLRKRLGSQGANGPGREAGLREMAANELGRRGPANVGWQPTRTGQRDGVAEIDCMQLIRNLQVILIAYKVWSLTWRQVRGERRSSSGVKEKLGV